MIVLANGNDVKYIALYYFSNILYFIMSFHLKIIHAFHLFTDKFVIVTLLIFVFPGIAFFPKAYQAITIYFLFASVLLSIFLIMMTSLYTAILILPALSFISLIAFIRNSKDCSGRELKKLVAFVIIFFVIYAMADLVSIGNVLAYVGITFRSIYNDIQPICTLLLFYQVRLIYDMLILILVSITTFAMFAGLSAILTENSFLILTLADGEKRNLFSNASAGITIWQEFRLEHQVIFSKVRWETSLAFMWFGTNVKFGEWMGRKIYGKTRLA